MLGASKPKGLNRIGKIDKCHLYLLHKLFSTSLGYGRFEDTLLRRHFVNILQPQV